MKIMIRRLEERERQRKASERFEQRLHQRQQNKQQMLLKTVIKTFYPLDFTSRLPSRPCTEVLFSRALQRITSPLLAHEPAGRAELDIDIYRET